MAFSASELHVLRRALAHALHSSTDPLPAQEVQDCLRLSRSLDEAVSEAGRLRAFLLDDLARYRAALPGSFPGYLELLQDALAAGYRPHPDDLSALRALRGNPVASALLDRCRAIAERSVRARLARTKARVAAPAPRTRLLALPGGLDEGDGTDPGPEGGGPEDRPADRDKPGPAAPSPPPDRPQAPRPDRPIPTPGEVFPPRRKPAPPPGSGRAVG
ncbi:hypothetical protein [Streptomyces sp. NPDC006879]|uniref:hypothetical protein n=1 Tax=Streptomyces sp. NPDC006879 TaxID=3364767 RepID=UPI0036924214